MCVKYVTTGKNVVKELVGIALTAGRRPSKGPAGQLNGEPPRLQRTYRRTTPGKGQQMSQPEMSGTGSNPAARRGLASTAAQAIGPTMLGSLG